MALAFTRPHNPRVPIIDEFVAFRVARPPLHDVALGALVRERDRRHHVSAQVDAQNGDGSQRQRHV